MPAECPRPDFLADDTRICESNTHLVWRVAELAAGELHEPDSLFRASNLCALSLIRLRDRESAEALCRAEIIAATARGAPNRRCSLYALEAQVNLLRIAAMCGESERALTGLSLLERVADGEYVPMADMCWDPSGVTGTEYLLRARVYARAVFVTDLCKALFRGNAYVRLERHAAHVIRRWPNTIREGLHCAAEVGPLLGSCDAGLRLDRADRTPSPQAGRLNLVLHLHALRAAAVTDGFLDPCEIRKAEDAIAQDAHPLVCRTSPLRWRAHLRTSQLICDPDDAALRQALSDLSEQARVMLDDQLVRTLAPLIDGEPGPPQPREQLHQRAAGSLELLLRALEESADARVT